MRVDKVLAKILRGTSDANIPFEGIRRLLLTWAFGSGFEGVTTFALKMGRGNPQSPAQR